MTDSMIKRLDKIADLEAQKSELEEAIKFLRASIKEEIEEGEVFVGEYKLVKYVNRRFDDALARKTLTPEKYNQIATLKADSKRAAALLSAEELDTCKKTFDTVLKIGARND